ncbi:unnamed protein product [Spirodela intermedia]|uniref:Uncharacterized protein n=1 Tax=Spirodela intermedia TaxID=51605 RepID=A0A7I8J0G8_SPIIN|nr:unnamed protein product [Spirodela intermedia]CAA6663549.1 unnamed protein product [Spirodela intermedia]
MDHAMMASAADSPLGRILVEEIAPVVMVLSTPLAEQACRKNGLDFVQMLRPFCFFENIDVPVRTASDQPYRLQEFILRLFYASDVRKHSSEVAENLLKQVVTDRSEIPFSKSQTDDLHYEGISAGRKTHLDAIRINRHDSESVPPWFQTFNRELLHTLSFSEHETFDHPVACLLVVSTNDDQPISRFVDLFNMEQLPSLLKDGTMDSKILKHYLLLHDNQTGNLEKASSILAEMKSTFGLKDSRLLCINSSPDGIWEGDHSPWFHYKNGVSLKQDNACFLTSDDLNQIRDFMQDLCSKHIIPHMEHKVRELNQQVSAIRKGFRNQIKNLWWRKGKEDTPEAPKGPMYTFNSTESQIRLLGDYAFMLCDYELALSNYRLLSTDYKLDKAWKHYAGAQEMVGLSLFMLDQSKKEAEYSMENAFHSYERIGSSGLRYATRCGLWWAEMFKERGQYKEAAAVYFRISIEEPSLHAAVMLEQASYCYLLSDPPMLRKYAFHLVLAGNRYYISEQVYKVWYALIGMLDVAIDHMVEVLACSHQSAATQKLFLNDFLRIVQSTGSKTEVSKLQLPLINMPSLKITFEDHRTYASSASVHVEESLWKTLEEDMIPSTYAAKSNWLESYTNLNALKKSNEASICVIGEPIKVYLEFKNPLQISISLSDVSLICELSPRPDGTELNVIISIMELENVYASYVLSRENFILGGGETRGVELDVTPRIQGLLKIVGVRWVFSDSIVGSHIFNTDIKRKRGKPRSNEDHFGSTLCFVVVKGLPKLEGCIHKMPHKTYAGDLRLVMLELKNHSEYSVKNLKMKISHPRFLIPESLGDLELNFPACLEKQIRSESSDIQEKIAFNSYEKSNGSFSFPNGTKIQGGTIFHWPLWLHAGVAGNLSQYISLYYEMENHSGDMTYRTLRMHYHIEVLPSLNISMSITPYPTKFEEFLLRMDIVNRTHTENFWLRQLSVVSSDWDISTLSSYASGHLSQLLPAGQSLVCFFKLKYFCSFFLLYVVSYLTHSIMHVRLGVSEINLLPIQGSDSRVGSEDTAKGLLDTFKSPLIDFHHHERRHQENSGQGCPSTADFILISQLVNSDPDELPQLFSHHSCHCRTASKDPVLWLLCGPHAITHDFGSSFCEADLVMRLHNSSTTAASVKVVIPDGMPALLGESSDDFASSNRGQGGWQDVPLASDPLTSALEGARPKMPQSGSDGQPFAWCRSSSSHLVLEPMSTVEVPVRVCIFSAGVHDLSNFELHWSLRAGETDPGTEDRRRSLSGMSRARPFYLTALQTVN